MIIRKANITEWKIIQNLNAQLFELEFNNYDESLDIHWPDRNEGYYKNAIISEDYHTLVCEEGNKIVGYIIASLYIRTGERLPSKSSKIQNIFISESHRGKRIGKQLIQKVETWAKNNGAVEISITASAKNTDALEVYRNLSYEEYDVILEKKL